jgi:hypothetical protein
MYEMSARRHFTRMSALFEGRATKKRVLHLRECAEYVFSHPKSIRTSARRSISRTSASKWPATRTSISRTYYYAVTKYHFEGGELKKYYKSVE